MASKKTTNKTEQASEAVLPEGLVQGIVVQASPESIKEIDNKIANAIGAIDKVEGGTVIEAKLEDPRYFYKGVVPGGFHNTYGEEVTNITTGQMAPILESLKTQFKEEDGFRYFFKYVDNIIFTIMVPLKFSKESESYFQLLYDRETFQVRL